MAEKDDKSLIGFDPLAWMSDGGEQEDNTMMPIFDAEGDSDQKETKSDTEKTIDTASVEVNTKGESESLQASSNQNQSNNKLVLASELKIQNVQTLYDELANILAQSDDIEIDASGVTAIDTSSLQLLTVFKQEMEHSDKQISIDFPSDQFVEASDLLGLSEVLGVDKPGSGFF